MTLTPRRQAGSLSRRRYSQHQHQHHQRPQRRLAEPTRPARTTFAAIEGVATYLPDRVLTSAEVEARLRLESPHVDVPEGIIERLTGVQQRHVAAADEQASDLAVAAARRALDRAGLQPADVDLLIFASSAQDMVEPATSHIVQSKLGTRAMCFDVKNACNSVVNAIHVAESMIATGAYETVLICSGEIPSRVVRYAVPDEETYRNGFVAYTLGDAGAAVVLRRSDGQRGLWFRHFATDSRHWEVMTLPGGGTAHPRDPEKTWFTGNGSSLRDAFRPLVPRAMLEAYAASDATLDEFPLVLVHQVSAAYLDQFREVCGVAEHRVVPTIHEYGNVASASLPLQLDIAWQDGRAAPGTNVMLVGKGAGISVAVMMLTL